MGTSPPTRIFDGFAFAALRRFAAGGARRADDIRPYGGTGLLVERMRRAARSSQGSLFFGGHRVRGTGGGTSPILHLYTIPSIW